MLDSITWLASFGAILIDLTIKATFILVFTVLVSVVFRRLSAAFRHAFCSLGLLSLILLPVLSLALPSWKVELPFVFAAKNGNTGTAPYDTATRTSAANLMPPSDFVGSLGTGVPVSQTATPELRSEHRRIKSEMPQAAPSKFSMVSITWLVGASILLFSTAFSFLRANQFRTASTEMVDPNWRAEFKRLTCGSRRLLQVQLLENAEARVPMMCGIFCPAIILPADYHAATPEDRRRILTHELAHVQRCDVATHFVGRVACSLYWFHPLAWWCLHRMRQEREYACDDLVLASGSVASEYAEQLLFVARQQFTAKRTLPGTIGIIHQRGLEQRIRVLLSDDTSHAQPRGIVLSSALAVFSLFTIGIAVITPQTFQETNSLQDGNSGSEPGEQILTNISKDAVPNVEDVAGGVSITCLDQKGMPIADAEVHLYQGRKDKTGEGEYVHFGPYKSDQNGKARCPTEVYLDKDDTFDRWVYARIPGKSIGIARSVNWANRTPFNSECIVRLQPSQTLDGQVKVPQGFDPTAVEVRVQVLHVFIGEGQMDYESFPRHRPFVGLDTALPETFSQRPDKEGRFKFEDVPVRGRIYLLAEGNELGQAQWWNGSDRVNAPAELTLKPQGLLSGQVLSPHGEPVRGIEVSARIISNGNRDVAHETTFRTETDDRGRYTLKGLPDWDFVLSATDPDNRWVVHPVENIRIKSGKTTNHELSLEEGVRVSGRVFDSDGKPVEGAGLTAVSDSRIGSPLSSDMSDSEGRYRLRLPSGPVRFYFNSLPPELTYPQPQTVKVLDIVNGQADLENVDLTIPRTQEKANEGSPDIPASDDGSAPLRDTLAVRKPLLEKLASDHGYRVSPDELVRHVPLPFPPARIEFYRLGHPSQFQSIPDGPSSMTFRWNGQELNQWGMTFSGSETEGYNLAGLLDSLVNIKDQRIEGPPELLKEWLPGDWVVRDNADRKEALEQLETILNEEFDLSLNLEFRNVEREVYVARGEYRLTPIDGQDEEVQIFATQPIPDSGAGGGSGEFDEFLEWLGRWISTPIVNEVESHPKRQISWTQHARSPATEQMQREDHDPITVLRNVTAQTNLQFTKERRTVEVLFVEKVAQ